MYILSLFGFTTPTVHVVSKQTCRTRTKMYDAATKLHISVQSVLKFMLQLWQLDYVLYFHSYKVSFMENDANTATDQATEGQR